MAEKSANDHLTAGNPRNALNPLGYADATIRPSSKVAWGALLFGILSFLLQVFQIPWAIAIIVWKLRVGRTPDEAQNLTTPQFLIMASPTLLAFVLGLYSLRRGGISWKNALGVIGFAASASLLLLALIVSVLPLYHSHR